MATFSQSDFCPIMDGVENLHQVRLVGIEIETQREDTAMQDWLVQAKRNGNIANWGRDGSDIEVVTHPITATLVHKGGEHFEKITKLLEENRCTVNSYAGTHINVSKIDGDYKYTYDNLMWLQIIFEEQFKKVFGRSTHWAQFCPSFMFQGDNKKWQNAQKTKMMFDIAYAGNNITEEFSRSRSKQLMITDKKNRYEFRGGKATVSLLEILAWSEFCLNVVDIAATKRDIAGVKFKDFLTGKYIEEYVTTVMAQNKDRELKSKDLSKTVGRTKKLTITDREENKVY